MKNGISDLHNYLFEEMDRLSNNDLDAQGLQMEVIRAKAMCNVAEQIISNQAVAVSAIKAMSEVTTDIHIPAFLEVKPE